MSHSCRAYSRTLVVQLLPRCGCVWKWLLVVIVVVSVAVPPGRTYAQDERVTVRIDGRPLFRVGALDDADAATRARRIETRIATLLENPNAIAPVQVQLSATDPTVRISTVAGVTVTTVTQTDADDNLTTVDALAQQWASAYR